MVMRSEPLLSNPAWRALQRHADEVNDLTLGDLFAADPQRGGRLVAEAAGLYLDYSKHRVTDTTLGLLLELAESAGLPARTEAMFRGDPINVTERRPALHVALRTPRDCSIEVDGP